MALEDLDNLFFRHSADDLIGYLPSLENQQRGNTADAEFPRDVHILVDVEFHNLDLTGMLPCDLFDRGCQHVAWTAPIGPEIHHYWLSLARLNHVHFEARVRYRLENV